MNLGVQSLQEPRAVQSLIVEPFGSGHDGASVSEADRVLRSARHAESNVESRCYRVARDPDLSAAGYQALVGDLAASGQLSSTSRTEVDDDRQVGFSDPGADSDNSPRERKRGAVLVRPLARLGDDPNWPRELEGFRAWGVSDSRPADTEDSRTHCGHLYSRPTFNDREQLASESWLPCGESVVADFRSHCVASQSPSVPGRDRGGYERMMVQPRSQRLITEPLRAP
jgi:hypothetical protein